jgi:hypothetical protein
MSQRKLEWVERPKKEERKNSLDIKILQERFFSLIAVSVLQKNLPSLRRKRLVALSFLKTVLKA